MSSHTTTTPPSLTLSVAEEMNPTKRCTMEDAYMIQPNLCSTDSAKYSFLAVYDGHGGREVCDFLHATFHNVVKQEVLLLEGSMQQKLEQSFLIADISSYQVGIDTSGATVAMCLLEYSGEQLVKIHAANAGDARIVYSCNAQRLTHDHMAHDANEMKRIEQAGGFVLKGRVLGVLAVARSLGDFGLKQYVIAKPYVSCTNVEDSTEEEFLILACDGLWDVVSDQLAVKLVRKWVKEENVSKQDVAPRLTKEAVARGSTDNITIIVCWL